MSKKDEYTNASRKLHEMSELVYFDDSYKNALKMGAIALDVLSTMEQLNEVTPITKDKGLK